MTVSRVLRDSRQVREQTRRKVQAAIKQTGYKPDPALSALAAYRTKDGGGKGSVLAFLDVDPDDYSQVVAEGARAEALLLGYTVDIFPMKREERSQKQLSRMLYHRGVRGLLFGPSDKRWHFAGWNWPEFAAVSLGALAHEPALHSVAMDYFQGAVDGWRLLKAEGCRNIGLALSAQLEERSGHRWIGGMLAESGGNRECLYLYQQWNARHFRAWLTKHNIDGVLTIHGEVVDTSLENNTKIVLLNEQSRRNGLSFLSLDPARIGAEGVRLLHHLLLRREYGLPQEPAHLALKGNYIHRDL
jgi:DNA-binding LacI/PurR family transcriptional regulator